MIIALPDLFSYSTNVVRSLVEPLLGLGGRLQLAKTLAAISCIVLITTLILIAKLVSFAAA